MSNRAVLTADDQSRAIDRASGSGIVIGGDRTREFERARRHSALIRFARVSAPSASIGIVVMYVWSMLHAAGYGVTVTAPTIAPTLGKEITMDNPHYEGFTKDGGSFVVTSKTAIPDLANPAIVKLNAITGALYDARKSRTDLTAVHGVFDNKANQLDLTDGITVITATGMRATLQTATMMTKDGTLVSKTPVKVEMQTGVVTSNQMLLNQKTRDVTFLDHVVTHLVTPPKAASAQAPVTPKSAAQATAIFGQSDAPIDVTSDRLDIHDAKKAAQFSGAVHAVQGEARLDTAVLDVAYEGNPADTTATPAPGAPDNPAQPATKIKRITAPHPVVLTQGTGDRVTGSSADFDAASEIAVVTGNVVMTSGIDRRATAERAEFDQKPDTILLTGNVVVNSARNELRGRKLFVDRKSGKTLLDSPAEGTLPKSRIFARLYQGDGQPAKPAAATKDKAVEQSAAANSPAGLMTFKTDPNAPIDIEADKLTVDDGKKLAVFSGDVKAAQADFTIRTIELHATYSGDGGLSVATPAISAAAVQGAPKTPAQLTKIEAKGKVVVSSKANQKVIGDWATFDTKANTVVVGGTEVVISQEQNIVTCFKVLIDTASGISRCVTETASAPGTAPGLPAGKQGRASAVFYPQERQKAGAAPAPPPVAQKPASSSWESSVEPGKAANR